MAEPHRQDILKSAKSLHIGKDGLPKVVEVDALQSLRDAKTQCAVSPGVGRPLHILTPTCINSGVSMLHNARAANLLAIVSSPQ